MALARNSARACIALAVAGVLLEIFSRGAAAQREFRLTEEEYLALPRYCQAQQFMQRDSPIQTVPRSEHQQWSAMLGPGFLGVHHHCRGLIFMQRAAASETPKARKENYHQAIANFSFMQGYVGNDFPLLPEICLRKGFAHLLIGEKAEAAREFNQAIRIKPDYTPAYGALIDYFVSFGELEEAQKVLDTGLKHAPSSSLLRQKTEELKALREPETNPLR